MPADCGAYRRGAVRAGRAMCCHGDSIQPPQASRSPQASGKAQVGRQLAAATASVPGAITGRGISRMPDKAICMLKMLPG